MPTVSVRERRKRQAAASTVTAGGALITSRPSEGETLKSEALNRLKKPWQARAFDYYYIIPEIWYAGQFYSRHMSKVELRIEYLDDSGEWVARPATIDAPETAAPAPNSAPPPPPLPADVLRLFDQTQGLLDRMRDPTGGRGELIATYGRLRFLVGECYLVCLDPDTAAERWEVLSMNELRPNETGKGYKRVKAEGLDAEELKEAPEDSSFEALPASARVWRLWRRDPQYSLAADAPMRAVMPVCEELASLTEAVLAQARSRIAKSGILKVPNEVSPPPVSAEPGEDPMTDEFLSDLILHIEAPLRDPGHPDSLVPLIVRGPAQYLAQLDQLQLHVSGADYPEAQLRAEAISRLANGLDMPREALLGTADVNHWGAWQIDQQTWSAHVQPIVEDMCIEFTSAILRPALEAQQGSGETLTRRQAARWRIWYDAVKITNHPDRGKDAQDVYDRGALSDAALRDAKGFNDDDTPSQSELARWVGVRTRDSGLAWYGVPTIRTSGAPEPPPPVEDIVPPEEGQTPPTNGGTGNDVTIGSPNADAARLLGAAENAVWSCRRTAGSRIVAKVQHGELKAVPRTQLYARLGAARVAELNGDRRYADRRWLVAGGTEAFESLLGQWGYPPERVQALARLVAEHAAATLDQEEPEALPLVLLGL